MDKIWGIMQDGVYARKITSVDKLKQPISDEWNKIDQQLIDSAQKQNKSFFSEHGASRTSDC